MSTPAERFAYALSRAGIDGFARHAMLIWWRQEVVHCETHYRADPMLPDPSTVERLKNKLRYDLARHIADNQSLCVEEQHDLNGFQVYTMRACVLRAEEPTP